MTVISADAVQTQEFGDSGSIWWAIGAGAGALTMGWQFMRNRFPLGPNKRRFADATEISLISQLQRSLSEERKGRQEAERRADEFAQERNEAIRMLGKLEGELSGCRAQIAALTAEVARLRDEMVAHQKD